MSVAILCYANNADKDQSSNIINKLNIEVDSLLNTVIQDAFYRMSSDTVSGYYSVLMNEYKGGTLVKAVKTKTGAYELREHWEGYAEVDGNIIVVDFGFSKYRPVFATPSESLTIQLKKFDDALHIMDIKYYYILDGSYAIYSPESGWIWSDGKPDEKYEFKDSNLMKQKK